MKYQVTWKEKVVQSKWAWVEAENETDARRQFDDGEEQDDKVTDEHSSTDISDVKVTPL